MLSKGASSYYGYIVLSSLAATLERGSFPFRGNPLGAALGASLFPSLLGSVFPVMISIALAMSESGGGGRTLILLSVQPACWEHTHHSPESWKSSARVRQPQICQHRGQGIAQNCLQLAQNHFSGIRKRLLNMDSH